MHILSRTAERVSFNIKYQNVTQIKKLRGKSNPITFGRCGETKRIDRGAKPQKQ